jgi:hypothetical protein
MELNLESTGSTFDEHRYGPASETTPALITEILRNLSQIQAFNDNYQ